jgi:hypothetical protein
MDKTRVESQERSGWMLRKSYTPAFGFKKHASFSPASSSEGEQLRFPPSDARLTPLTALCLPFSGRTFTPALRPRGHIPFATPTDLCPLRRTQIRQKRLGFRLRSPLPSGEELCPLRLQTVFFTHKPSQNRGLISLGQSLRVFDVLSLIYSTSCYHGFGDASYHYSDFLSAFSILAHVSRRVVVRLNTGTPGEESTLSTQKYPCLKNW